MLMQTKNFSIECYCAAAVHSLVLFILLCRNRDNSRVRFMDFPFFFHSLRGKLTSPTTLDARVEVFRLKVVSVPGIGFSLPARADAGVQ